MNKTVKKVIKWVIGIIVVVSLILMALGYNLHNNAEQFVKDQGGLNVQVIGSNNRIMCRSGVGLVVLYNTKEDTKMRPTGICSGLGVETHVGRVAD